MTMSRDLEKFVRRYTTLSSVLDTLANRRLVLLSPSKWDDTNDVDFMQLYRDRIGASSILALCCAQATETYHHWRVFTHGMEGVCIEFKKQALVAAIDSHDGVEARSVDYLLVKELAAMGPQDVHRLPFVKRDGYSDEREWRIVATKYDEVCDFLPISVPIETVNRLVLNPWLPPSLGDNLRNLIRQIPGCERISIVSSRLTNSRRWKDAGKKIAHS